MTGFPCAERYLGTGCPQGSKPLGELSTGCAGDLWISESITPKVGDHAEDSLLKPASTPAFEWKGALQRMARRKRVDER